MSKSKNTQNNSISPEDKLRKELADAQAKIKELQARLADGSAIDVTTFVEPGDFARLALPDSFFGHDTREALYDASRAAADELSCGDIFLGFWQWMASPDGLQQRLHKEIGKSNGIANPINETLGYIKKAIKPFAAKSKASAETRAKKAEATAAAAEKRARELELKLAAAIARLDKSDL